MVAFPRETGGKGLNRQMRLKGMIPGVIYGRGRTPRHISLESAALKKALATAGGMNVLLDLEVKGAEGGSAVETVMVKELQRHPLQQDFYLHADLLRISLDQKLEVKVPLSFSGEPAGVKDGGIFQAQFREVGVRCLPAQIPDFIKVPVEGLEIGQAVNIKDLKLPEGVEILEDPEQTVSSVLAPQAEAVEEEEAEAAEAETGAGAEEEAPGTAHGEETA